MVWKQKVTGIEITRSATVVKNEDSPRHCQSNFCNRGKSKCKCNGDNWVLVCGDEKGLRRLLLRDILPWSFIIF